jgi:RNase P subunit RPR2
MERTEGMQKALDTVGTLAYGRTNTEAIKENICISCGHPALAFNDETSRVEYSISGLCQSCQDIVFNPYREDYED